MIMKRTRVLFLLAFLMCSWRGVLKAQSLESAQADSDMVRATYAKLIFITRATDIREGVLGGLGNREAQERIRQQLLVTLSDIKTGPVSDLRSVLYSDLVTKPSGNVLSVTTGSWTDNTDGHALHGPVSMLEWQVSAGLAQDWSVPFSQVLAVVGPGYTRYASFTAKISYAGRGRQYQALFLFGEDAAGKAITLPLDNIIGPSALSAIAEAPSTPDLLLAQSFRDRSETKSLIRAMRLSPNCTAEPRTKMCCDENTGQCGLHPDVLRQHGFASSIEESSLTPDSTGYTGRFVNASQTWGFGQAPARLVYASLSGSVGMSSMHAQACYSCSGRNYSGQPDYNTDGGDTTGHVSGEHEGDVTITKQCSYNVENGSCYPRCHMVVNGHKNEYGTLSAQIIITPTACHVLAANVNGMDSGGTQQCSGSWGYAATLCLFCSCSLNVSVGIPVGTGNVGVTTSSTSAGGPWGWGFTDSCKQ
jgi:hypothetical protein